MADWEIGHVTAELGSRRFFRKDAPETVLRTFGLTKDPVRSMGGLAVMPDLGLDSLALCKEDILVLPGSDTWADPKHMPVLDIVSKHLSAGGTVCAICGATVALAFLGILDSRRHTSNGAGFLEMFCPAYKGSSHYVDEPAVSDGNLITAGSTGGIRWACLILEKLGVFSEEALRSWEEYFTTGSSAAFFSLMDAVQKSRM